MLSTLQRTAGVGEGLAVGLMIPKCHYPEDKSISLREQTKMRTKIHTKSMLIAGHKNRNNTHQTPNTFSHIKPSN